jgi:hypothetical protein
MDGRAAGSIANDARTRASAIILVAATLPFLLCGCGGSSNSHSIGLGIRVDAKAGPPHAEATHATTAGPPVAGGLTTLSPVYDFRPSGPLPAPATVTIPLHPAAPPGEAVVVATAETAAGPWTYLKAKLSPNQTSVTFTTAHFSWYQVLGYDVHKLTSAFKTDFLDQIDGGATTTVTKPTCSGQAQLSDEGYATRTVSKTDTIYWCLGLSGATPSLEVVNNRHYPLEILHPHLTVIDPGTIDYGQLASLSHFASGGFTILAPGDQATFGVALQPGHAGAVETQMDGFGQSLYALQVGVNTLVEILAKFGLGSEHASVNIASTMLGDTSCLDSIGHGPAALLASCFSPKDLARAFGTAKSVVLIPIIVAGPVVAFFTSEYQALIDQFNSDDKYDLEIVRSAAAPCSPTVLFQAAVAKEHFNPNDPSYAQLGTDGNHPGAYGLVCDGDWAIALISRPNVGTTDGETLFNETGGAWREVGMLGGSVAECQMGRFDVPTAVAAVLSHGIQGSGIAGCDVPGAYTQALQDWKSNACGVAVEAASNYRGVEADLEQAGPQYAGNPSGYKAAISELQALAAIPDVNPTTTEVAQEHSDLTELDAFFKTPGLYTTSSCQSP